MIKTKGLTENKNPVIDNPWRELRQFTDARIGVGRAGVSLPTDELLQFQLAHARARDAVHTPLNINRLCEQITVLQNEQTLLNANAPFCVRSEAADRRVYLQRPDLGRRLSSESREKLQATVPDPAQPFDLSIVIADGLSANAISLNAVDFIRALTEELASQSLILTFAPIILVEQGRVAIADDIGALLNARTTLMLIGERPGLSSPDSLGIYLTYAPQPGLTDDRRNCLSNVRKAGLSCYEAARRTLYLLRETRQQQTSGIAIKDRSDAGLINHNPQSGRSFLLGSEEQ